MASSGSCMWLVAVVVLVLVRGGANADMQAAWERELPSTAMPESMGKLSSPLSAASSDELLAQVMSTSKGQATYCGLAKAASCSRASAAVFPVRGPQPRVCIPPFFNYEYGVLPCRHNDEAVSEAAQSAIFFKPTALAEGKRMTIPKTSNDLAGRFFLPEALAHALPFDSSRLPELTSFYGVPRASGMELDMENTLAHCAYVSEHEIKSCHTSGESMVRQVAAELGHHATVWTPRPFAKKQQAQVLRVQQLARPGRNVMGCHDMRFPSLVVSCHVTQTSELLDVALQLDDGELAHGLAVCHADTSFWNPTHVAFGALRMKPGKGRVCHWLPENSFVFM